MQLADASSAEPFETYGTNFTLGEDLMAYGYPEDVMGFTAGMPTPCLFRGHYQRYMYFYSHNGYAYNAGELSIPAPWGLSGGPVFRPAAVSLVTGLVAENLKSTTTLVAFEEHRGPHHIKQVSHEEIIQYGVSLLLDSWKLWLSEKIPS